MIPKAPALLGSLVRIAPREVWKYEDRDFTPWLRDHIEELARELGIEIEVEGETVGIEVGVGDFVADLLGHEPRSGRKVVIENQLQATDHAHLGALLTYSSGLDAGIIVWIATQFRDEHRQALDWLNQHTDKALDFFGAELELLRIGSSLPAPHFNVVAQPNNWAKVARKGAGAPGLSERELRYQRFFSDLLSVARASRPNLTTNNRVGGENYCSFGVPGVGTLGWSFKASGQFGVELWIDTGDRTLNERIFDRIRKCEAQLAVLGPLSWDRGGQARRALVGTYRPGTINEPEEKLKELTQWGVTEMLQFADVLKPLAQGIATEERAATAAGGLT